MSISVDMRFVIKWLQVAIIQNHDIWNNIAITVALNFLYNNFKSTTTIMLEHSDKTINKIQQILAFAEAKSISNQAIGVIGDLVIMSKGWTKRKATKKNKCLNWGN